MAIFIVLAGMAGAVYILRLPQWQIEKIEITGLEVLDEEEVREKVLSRLKGEYVFLIPRSSILATGSEGIEHFLKNETPRVKSVNISKRFPDALKVHIEERKLWAIYCNNLETIDATTTLLVEREESCVYIDHDGFAYEEAPDSSGPLILKIRSDAEDLPLAETVLGEERISRMKEIFGVFEKDLRIGVIGYEFFSKIPGEVRIATADGFKIRMNFEDDLEKISRVLKTVLEEEIGERRGELEYIDARFGNKVFYKLK